MIQTLPIVIVYLIVIVCANISVALFGETAFYINGFLLIPFDMFSRDALHEKWKNKNITLRMGSLIVLGGLLTYFLNQDTSLIAIASVVSFTVSSIVDALVYQKLINKTKFVRMNVSNIFSSILDTLLFITMVFGFSWKIILIQSLIKFGGGLLFTTLLKNKI